MSDQRVIAFFNSAKELQKALNSFTQGGISQDNISIIMKNLNNKKISEPYDEKDPMNQAFGLIDNLSAENINAESFNIPGMGEVIVAGAIIDKLDESDFEDNAEETSIRLDNLLKSIGIIDEKIKGFEDRINSGQIFFYQIVDKDQKEEIAIILSDNGADLLNFDTSFN